MTDKKPNWFKRHKILTIVGAFIILIAIVSAAGGGSKKTTLSSDKTSSSTAQTASEDKPATRQVTGTATTIGAGTATGGKDVPVGLYDVTPGDGQSGNFIVTGADTYNDILGSAGAAGGVAKVRAQISNGDKIVISGLSSVIFTPVTAAFVSAHTATDLYAGTFTVGQDVGAGDYTVTPGAGQSGNFIVSGSDTYNEILGGDSAYGGVSSVSVSLHKGSKITISSLGQVTFTPKN